VQLGVLKNLDHGGDVFGFGNGGDVGGHFDETRIEQMRPEPGETVAQTRFECGIAEVSDPLRTGRLGEPIVVEDLVG